MARRRPSRFLVALLVIIAVGELPIALLLARLLAPLVARPGLTALALCALATTPMALRVRRGGGDQSERGWLRWPLLGFYLFWATSLCAVLALPLVGLARLLLPLPSPLPSALTLAAGFVIGLCGMTWNRLRLQLRHVDVPVSGLDSSLEGFRIAQLSDLHIGAHTPPERLRRWVDRVNALDVDLVAVTGDLITRGDDWVAAMARELGRLRARSGVFVCLGNHDYFADVEALVAALEATGLEVLRNRGRVVGEGQRRLYVAGVDDTWSRRADVHAALAGRDPALPALLLAHDPLLFPTAASLDATLVLSGHTHGGQVALPLWPATFNLARLYFPHVAGLYRRGSSHLYVNRGAGTTGPPLRIGAPSELTLLTLRSL